MLSSRMLDNFVKYYPIELLVMDEIKKFVQTEHIHHIQKVLEDVNQSLKISESLQVNELFFLKVSPWIKQVNLLIIGESKLQDGSCS